MLTVQKVPDLFALSTVCVGWIFIKLCENVEFDIWSSGLKKTRSFKVKVDYMLGL